MTRTLKHFLWVIGYLTSFVFPNLASAERTLKIFVVHENGANYRDANLNPGDTFTYNVFWNETFDPSIGETSQLGNTFTNNAKAGSVSASLVSTQSTFVSFQPNSSWDGPSNIIEVTPRELYFNLSAVNGVSVINTSTPGVVSGTLGKLTMTLGPWIPVDPTFTGIPYQVYVLDITSAGNPARVNNLTRFPSGQLLSGFTPQENKFIETKYSRPIPTPVPTVGPGQFSLSTRSYTASNGSFISQFSCSGQVGATCTGKAKFYDSSSVVKSKSASNALPNAKTVYSTCTISKSISPAVGECTMKLSALAKGILKKKKKVAGSLAFTSSGRTKPVVSSITVK